MDEKIFQKTIGERIKEARIAKNMTQFDLAYFANVSQTHLSDIENGKSKTTLNIFVRIIEALQVSADEILRPSVPQVNAIYQQELADILKDCTSTEIDSILAIVRQVKQTLHSKKDNEDE